MNTDHQTPMHSIFKHSQDQMGQQNRQGHWSTEEHHQYLQFLQEQKELIESTTHSKGQRLFKKMSSIIGTRSPSQCRSHHQKFNPFSTQLIKKRKAKKTLKKPTNKGPVSLLTSKQFIRKLFSRQKKTHSETEEDIESIEEEQMKIEPIE